MLSWTAALLSAFCSLRLQQCLEHCSCAFSISSYNMKLNLTTTTVQADQLLNDITHACQAVKCKRSKLAQYRYGCLGFNF